MKNLKLKYIFAFICILLVAILGFYKTGIFTPTSDVPISGKNHWIIKEVPIDKYSNSEIAVIPKWEEMSISQQFSDLTYHDYSYSSNVTKISSDNLLKHIGTSNLTGYDIDTKSIYHKKGEIYPIKALSDECAVAVKFEEDDNYYVYVNPYYKPKTLGAFMDDLNLKEITSFGTIYYSYWDNVSKKNINVEFYNVDNTIIWQKLFDNVNLENIYNDTAKYTIENSTQSINIDVTIPLLGCKNISISLTDKGYLLTNILGSGKGFYIGENKVQAFLDYIKENNDGYQIVYVDRNGNKIVDEEGTQEEQNIQNNIIKEDIMMIENKTGNSTVVNVVPSKENKVESKEI